jgi:hypothetical protein
VLTDDSTEEQNISESSLKQSRYEHIISYRASSCDLNTHTETLYLDSGGILGATARICKHESPVWLEVKQQQIILSRMHILLVYAL